MKLYATVLAILVTGVACRPMEINPYITIPSIDNKQTKLRENMRQKRFVPIVGDILGRVGETILGVGTGLIGLRAGVQHGVQAGRLLNNGNWGYGYEPYYGPEYGNGYYGPGYVNGYYGPGYVNGYYGPGYGNGYYGPGYNNGYYGPVPNNGPGNNGGYGGGPGSSCRTPQGTPC